MRLAPLALAALLFAPAAAAQVFVSPTATTDVAAAPARLAAPGDTSLTTPVPPGTTSISTWQFGEGNFLFGTNDAGIFGFGSAYTLPDDGAAYEVIGARLFVTVVPDAGESFSVSVYEGTLEDGPVGEPVRTETFDTGDIEPRGADNTIAPTDLFFETAVEVAGDLFFLTYDVDGVTTAFGVGGTADQDVATPETVFRVVLEDGQPPEWARVDAIASIGEGNPLETYLFGAAILREKGDPNEPVAVASARAAGVGAEVRVRGVVSRAEGAYTYLQDETGGLALRQTSGEVFDAVQNGVLRPGAEIEVAGTLSEFNGLLQINGAALTAYTYLGQGDAPAAQVVTFAEFAANGEAYESELVEVDGVTFADLDPPATFEASTNYDASDASGSGVVRIQTADDTEIDGTQFIAEPAIVTGVLVQNSSTDPAAGYRVAPIDAGDVRNAAVAVGESPDGRLGLGAAAPNPSSAVATVAVSLAAAGDAVVAVYDVLGREVARVLDGPLAAGTTPVGIDVAGLPAGTYLVRLSAGGAVATRPLTVVR